MDEQGEKMKAIYDNLQNAQWERYDVIFWVCRISFSFFYFFIFSFFHFFIFSFFHFFIFSFFHFFSSSPLPQNNPFAHEHIICKGDKPDLVPRHLALQFLI